MRCRRWASGSALVLLACFLAFLPAGQGLGQRPGAPPIDVVDGDTLFLDGKLYRLHGIDAPELGQTCLNADMEWPCGLEAALALRKMVTISSELSCRWIKHETDLSDFSATCSVGTEDLARRMLLSGYAVALEGVVPGYAEAQETAKNGKLGIWRGEFTYPSEWRERHQVDDPAAAAKRCVIKGKITDSGAKVYHLPGDKGYDQMQIDNERGERFFCSDDAARIAGWSRYPK